MNVNDTHNRYLSLASTALIEFPSRRISEASCTRRIRDDGRTPFSESRRSMRNVAMKDDTMFFPEASSVHHVIEK